MRWSAGRCSTPNTNRLWRDSPQVEDPDKPAGQWYGYGITQQKVGDIDPDLHGGETAGYNSFMGVDAANDMTLVIWTNRPVNVDTMRQTANSLMVKVLDLIYVDPPGAAVASPAAPSTAPTAAFEQRRLPHARISRSPGVGLPGDHDLRVPDRAGEPQPPDGRTIKIFVPRRPAVSATPAARPARGAVGGPGGAGSISYAAMTRAG